MTCPRCVQGVVLKNAGDGPSGVFCDCPAGRDAAAKPCLCPTLADLVPGFGAMLDDLASTLPPLTAEEGAGVICLGVVEFDHGRPRVA